VRAFTLDSFESPPRLRDDLPEPTAAEGELLIRVHASSVNPVDAAIAGGVLKEMAEHDFPVTLGRDLAGVVERVGRDVSRYQIGDEVYGFLPAVNPTVHEGSWAELITVPEFNFVAPKPRNLDLAEAGAAPLAGITALAARDVLEPTSDKTILVIGATGGVGSFFVQLASAAGAHVVAPALPEDEGYLRDLGTSEILDRDADLDITVDAILDVVSYAPRGDLLNEGGRLASPLGAAGDGPLRFNLVAQPTPENLQRLGELLDDRTLRVHLQRNYLLAHAAEALQALSNVHKQGKLGVEIA